MPLNSNFKYSKHNLKWSNQSYTLIVSITLFDAIENQKMKLAIVLEVIFVVVVEKSLKSQI